MGRNILFLKNVEYQPTNSLLFKSIKKYRGVD